MTEVLSKYLEVAVSIFIYVTASILTLALLITAREPIIEQGSDKTLVESTGVQKHYESELYGYDLLLMLLNLDSMSPYPKAIKINDTPVINLNNAFLAYKMRNVAAIYSETGDYKLSKMLNYKVTSKKYVYEGADAPYMHYTLEEVSSD